MSNNAKLDYNKRQSEQKVFDGIKEEHLKIIQEQLKMQKTHLHTKHTTAVFHPPMGESNCLQLGERVLVTLRVIPLAKTIVSQLR